jgi:ABC-type transporter Mla subunit MlaD
MIAVEEDRRTLLFGIVTLGAMTLPACSPQDEAKPSATATLLNHDKIVQAVDSLSGAVDDLNASLGGFDDENWQDVVPKVKEAASNVDSALADLKNLMAGTTPDQ